jgi:predicted nuclease of predicted toxin-antitoxin system
VPRVRSPSDHGPVCRRGVRLKLDENLGRRWATVLEAAGHDLDTVRDEHLSGAADAVVLEASRLESRVLVTLDMDFANPLRFPPEQTAGLAVLRVRDRPGKSDLDVVVQRLVDALAKADIGGRLWIVEADRVRQYEPPSD